MFLFWLESRAPRVVADDSLLVEGNMICTCPPETFWSLLHDAAHWEFEVFLMILFDGLVGALLWPFLKKHYAHHVARDKKDGL